VGYKTGEGSASQEAGGGDRMKQCTKCKQWKPESSFYKAEKGKPNLRNPCKSCINERVKNHYRKPKAKRVHRNSRLKKKFGITVEDYDRMLINQNGVCAICNQPETKANQFGIIRLAVDHNHKTGRVRGLLCTNCNNGLGRMKDSKELLLKAALYLEQHES